jgi:putative ABC transport system permease protein
MADRMFKGRSAVGRRLVYRGGQAPPITIIGVASDVKITGLDQELRPVIYYSFPQNTSIFANLVIRTTTEPTALAATVRHEIQTLEPQAAVFNMRAMPELISATPAAFMRRFPATLMGVFAGLALLLSAIGIYGVVSDSVAQQTHHIGVRIALGAGAGDIIRMVLKEGFWLAALGVGIGVAAAFGLMRLMSALLFGVQTHDVTVFAVVAGTLFLITLLACYLPARRATRVDPLVALRYE